MRRIQSMPLRTCRCCLRRPTRARLLRRQQRGKPLPLRVGQFKASHLAHIGLITKPVNPFAETP